MSILDKAQRYDLNAEWCNRCAAQMKEADDGDYFSTDDPVLAALVEYYEATEDFLYNDHLTVDTANSAGSRFSSARAAITKLRDGR